MKNVTTRLPTLLLLGAAASMSAGSTTEAQAEDATSQRDALSERGGRRPPPEAFSACADKSEGAACSVSFHERTLEGVCVAPSDDQLFCMPNDMPPPPSGEKPDRPPPRVVM